MSQWYLLVLLGLTTYRVTRLIVRDDFPPIRWGREKIERKGPEWLGDLVTCHWCASAYVAAGAVIGAEIFTSVVLPVLTWFAAWAIGALIAQFEILITKEVISGSNSH